MERIMNKIYKLAALLSVCLLAFAGCSQEELSTDQYSDDSVTFAAFAPNPVARGGALRIVGSNLQRVTEVHIPGVEPITDIEVVSEGRQSEIRVIVPVDGPEVGPVSIIADGQTYKSLVDLTYSEPIIFDGFSPAEAMPGDIITIKGDYMNNIREVVFSNGVYVTEFESQSRYELKVAVPAQAVTGKIIIGDVDENNNTDGAVANLFYSETELTIGQPTVKVSDKGAVKAGEEVVVSGEYLDMIAGVNFGGVEAEYTVSEDGKTLTVVLPDTAVDGELVLISYAGDEFKAGAYTTVVPSDLKVAAKTRYKAGLEAVVSGKDLDLVTSAFLNGTALEYVYADGQITFTIPASATDGVVSLGLANGVYVDTEAIELVKPVISAMTPLELYAGDENIVVTGTDLDLVTGVTLGGKETEFKAVDDKTIEVVTDATSVSGKVVCSLANGVTVESADEITINYHALVVVNSMPTAEHIGAKVTLTGVNFMLVENIYIGEAKVTTYFSRTDEEVSFVMPWNKVGSYNIYFDLLNGDREMVATPIEVLLEIQYIIGWEGSTAISWGDGGRVYVPASRFEGVSAGAKMRLYYTQKDQVWAQAQINYGDWSGLVFPEIGSNTLIPTDIYGWFADGILDRCTEVTLTQEILDNIQAKKGNVDSENVIGAGIIIQGQDLTFTKVEILQEISQEVTLWEGEVISSGWSGQGLLSDAGVELQQAGAKAGQEINFYVEPLEDAWQLKIVEGHWGPTYLAVCASADNTGDGEFTPYDLAGNGGKVKFTLTQEMLDAAFTQKWWGNTFLLQANNVKCTKITLL